MQAVPLILMIVHLVVQMVLKLVTLKRGSYKQPSDAVRRNRIPDPTPHQTQVSQKAVSYKKLLRDQ